MPITAVIIVVLFAGAAAGHGGGRPDLRTGDDRLVRGHRRAAASSASPSHPAILKALSPTYALGFLVGHFGIAFFALAAVVLAVTGAEALYADMGHFGRRAITRGWLFLVFPACVLSYLGQGALILDEPGATSAARSSCSRPAGRGCRWSCWPPPRR